MLSLNDREWKPFLISDIYTYAKGNQNNMGSLSDGNIPLVSARKFDNGLKAFVDKNDKTIFQGNCISYNNDGNGGAGLSFFQPFDFYLDSHCTALMPKETNEKLAMIAMVSCLNAQQDKYNHGYALNSNRINKFRFLLPVNPSGQPDYDFMEAYVKEREQIKVERYTQYCKERFSELGRFVDIESLSSKSWGSFFIKKIFDEIERGKRLKKEDHISGGKPYVSSTSLNNGVDQFIGNENKTRVFEDCLSLANSGSVGSCFYEPFQFVASDHVTHLKKYDTSKYIYLFMATMLNRLSEKYNFNREINDSRISREKILLPITEAGEPDYDYMAQYAKNMMIRKYQQYLDYYEKAKI